MMQIQQVMGVYKQMRWRRVKASFSFTTARVNPSALCSVLLNSKQIILGQAIKYTAIGIGIHRIRHIATSVSRGGVSLSHGLLTDIVIAGMVTQVGAYAAKKVATKNVVKNSGEKGTIPKNVVDMIDDPVISENYMELINTVALRDELMLDVFSAWVEGDSLKSYASKFEELTRKIKALSNRRSMVVTALKKHNASKDEIRVVVDVFKTAKDGSATLLPAIDKTNTS